MIKVETHFETNLNHMNKEISSCWQPTLNSYEYNIHELAIYRSQKNI